MGVIASQGLQPLVSVVDPLHIVPFGPNPMLAILRFRV
jgi:hypothetical protein